MLNFVKNLLGGSNESTLRKLEKTVKAVDALEEEYKKLTDEQLAAIDFNRNGKPDASETLTLMKYIVGLTESL